MPLRPLHPALLSYLRAVQSATTVGTHAFLRQHRRYAPRTVYRWQVALGEDLLIVPSVLTEALGLLHAHLFITEDRETWASCPYAIEAALGSANLSQDVLYLHCLVPASHQAAVAAQWSGIGGVRVLWSGTGWQQFVTPNKPLSLPLPSVHADVTVPARHPFVVPVMAESWRYPNSMVMIWSRATKRLATDMGQYFRRETARAGKHQVRAAFDTLGSKHLIVQHIIRYHPLLCANFELFIVITGSREELLHVLEQLRADLRATETYPMGRGYLCRLLGPHSILDAIASLELRDRDRIEFFCRNTKRHPTSVSFQYDRLFDPKAGTWREVHTE